MWLFLREVELYTDFRTGRLADQLAYKKILNLIANEWCHKNWPTGWGSLLRRFRDIEMYKNPVFDLLDDTLTDPLRPKQLQSKILREDDHHNMYVHGGTEVEVKSPDEASEL